MDDVRINLPDAPDELFRGPARGEAMGVEETCCHGVDGQVQLVPDRNQLRSMLRHAVAGAAVGDIAFPSGGDGYFADLLHDTSGRGVEPDHGIDLQKLAGHDLPPTNTPVRRGKMVFNTINKPVTVASVRMAVSR